jgi:hypothetical protein
VEKKLATTALPQRQPLADMLQTISYFPVEKQQLRPHLPPWRPPATMA